MLKRSFRLVKRGSFTFVYNKGERKSDKLITLIFVKSKSLKVGFSVNNKVGNAVKRNVVKRRLRAIVRELLPRLSKAQLVLSVRPGITELSYLEIHAQVVKLFTNANLFKQEN